MRQPLDRFQMNSNPLSCPPPVDVILPGLPPSSSGAILTTQAKNARERLKENNLLLEILNGAGHHAKLWKSLLSLTKERRKVFASYLWQQYAPSTLRGRRQKMQKWIAWHALCHPGKDFWPLTTEKLMDLPCSTSGGTMWPLGAWSDCVHYRSCLQIVPDGVP